MSSQPNPQRALRFRAARVRRIVGISTGLAVSAATLLVPTTSAVASKGTMLDAPRSFKVLNKGDLPAGAMRMTKPTPREGSYGKPFTGRAGSAQTRVVGGVEVPASEYPGVVFILSEFTMFDVTGEPTRYALSCTGTVISPTKVLTASHCVTDLPLGTISVIAGRSDAADESGGYVARVATTYTHQGYNLAAQYEDPHQVPVDDVSVLFLKSPLPAAYAPVTLSAQGDQTPYADGTAALAVGYGTALADPDVPNDPTLGILRKATVPMRSDADCAARWADSYDASRMVCAGDTGVDTCAGDSGGPLFVDGQQVGITSWGSDPCNGVYGVYERISYYADSIPAAQDLPRETLVNMDWGGDGHSDLIGRTATGDLILTGGSGVGSDGYGGIVSYSIIGTGFAGYNKIFRTMNWNGDNTPSIMARDSAGNLYQWKTDGRGNYVGARTLIGTGWNTFADIMVTNNWMSDGRPNLMGRKPNGDLVIYTSNGAGGWSNPRGTLIGTGWGHFNTVLTPGSWLGDGKQSLIGRRDNGDLVLYNSNGAGGWSNPRGTLIGTGWKGFSVFMSPGDWNGDNLIDLMGVNSSGTLRIYTSDGKGAWLDGRGKDVDTGWNAFNMVF